jgi:DNA-binding transcriptional LysR family regulator
MALNGDGSDHIADGGLDSDLLRTLVAVAATGSFTRAAQAVLRTPSAVSMQMKRLEDIVGRPIFAKDGRSVAFTADGEALLGYARRILRLQEEAMARFRAHDVEGVVRLGTPDDYATRFLPRILARFALTHPLVQVDVACQPSRELLGRLAANEIDLALVTVGCRGEPATGTIIHREPLVWAGLRHGRAHERRPLPLAVSGSSCAWRMSALERLDSAGVPYRVAYTSEHYVGQLAAVLADLAVAPLPTSVLTCGLSRIDDRLLPPLGFYEIELKSAPRANGPAIAALVEHIVVSFADGGEGATNGDVWASRAEADPNVIEAPAPGPSRRAIAQRSGRTSADRL